MGTVIFIILGIFTILGGVCIGNYKKWSAHYLLYIILGILLMLDLLYFNEKFNFFDCLVAFSFVYSIINIAYLLIGRIKNKIIVVLIELILYIIILFPLVFKVVLKLDYFSKEIMIGIYQTDIMEAWDFVKSEISIGYCLIPLILGLILFKINRRAEFKIPNKFVGILLIGFVAIFGTSYSYCSSISYIKESKNIYDKLLEDMNKKEIVDYSIFSYQQRDSITCVLIVGESLCRDYMSAYGYSVKTTPNIESLIQDSILIKFENTYSSDIKTIKCIPEMLTSKSQFCKYGQYNIIDLLKTNGFKTYWLGNQRKMGFIETPMSVIASNADVKRYRKLGGGYDGELIPIFEKAIRDTSKFKLIILNFMGSHSSAEANYPHIKPFLRDINYSDEILYHYENSIIYNDYLINEIYKIICNKDDVIMIYSSDHGEKPGELRWDDRMDFQMCRVPLLLYMSPNLRTNEQYFQLINNREKYWTNELFFNLACGLLNISNDSILKQECDISSSKYKLTKDSFGIIQGRYKMSTDPYIK